MKIDLLHNKIVADTITESFSQSFAENLVPLLEEKHGGSLIGVQMYEDYLADGFVYEGDFYYPLTLVFEDLQKREWIKWRVSDKKSFADGIPYAFVGKEPLRFELADSVPAEFEKRLECRGCYFEGGYISFSIESPSAEKLFLVGKYSQTFIDEMARQISREIEKTFSITGIEESTAALFLPFAPGTFMEHIVDGVTYRRLLISAKGCAPRDLWIKWTSKNDRTVLTVSNNVSADDVLFELGEDVSGKIKEKEYRYLVRSSADEYQAAMSRKNITEWRDLFKRIIKRGEVERVEVVTMDAEKSSELTFKLQEVLGFAPVPEAPKEKVQEDTNSDLAALLKGVLGVSEESVPEKDGLPFDAVSTVESVDPFAALSLEEESYDQVNEYEKIESETATASEASAAEQSYEDELRKKIEAEIREKLELEAKARAEQEALELRREHEALKAENERLAEAARKAEEERLAFEAQKALETERLRIEIESRERAEARERERMAEAARIAIIEHQKLMAARAEEERLRAEAEQKAMEEAKRAEEEAKNAEFRRLEQERIRSEMQAHVQEERSKAEAKAEAEEQERFRVLSGAEASPKMQTGCTYVSKLARLLFRYPVDPNVTKRIHEIILTTIKYFHKEDVYIKIKATVPDSTTVHLHFEKIPAEENELLVNIIKVLGKSDLGITKVYLE